MFARHLKPVAGPARVALDKILDSRAKILGAILNNVTQGQSDYYYDHYYYYYYGDGKDENEPVGPKKKHYITRI